MTWREICSQGVRSATMPQPLLQLETIFSRTIHLFFLSSFSLKSSQTQKIDWSICFYPFFVSRRLEYWLRFQNRPTEFLVSLSLDSGKKYFWEIGSGHILVSVFKVELVFKDYWHDCLHSAEDTFNETQQSVKLCCLFLRAKSDLF